MKQSIIKVEADYFSGDLVTMLPNLPVILLINQLTFLVYRTSENSEKCSSCVLQSDIVKVLYFLTSLPRLCLLASSPLILTEDVNL